MDYSVYKRGILFVLLFYLQGPYFSNPKFYHEGRIHIIFFLLFQVSLIFSQFHFYG